MPALSLISLRPLWRRHACAQAAALLAAACLPAAWADDVVPQPAHVPASAPQAQPSQVFALGTVEVRARRDDSGDGDATGTAIVSAQQMQLRNASTVANAVAWTPGVSLTRNSRNEEMLHLRGFDVRQVPVYVDGIPLYVPYDGYVDFGRFTTFDLSEIRVGKSAASLMYGPNTLGGAINLVTRKPARPFEGNAHLGLAAGQERSAALNLGGNQGRWYYQVGLSYLDADSFKLPKGFTDYKRNPTDTGRWRQNAYRTDQRLSFKLGLTPNASDEYALGYVRQEGEKGNPVYTGRSTARNAARYWRWPYWDKDSLYFLSRTQLGAHNLLSARLWYDRYENGLDMYTNASYSRHDPTSSYKDASYGASLEWANDSLARHALRLALHYKADKHQEAASGRDPEKNYRDVTTSLAAEDAIALADRWQLTLGLSHDRRSAKRVYQWPTGSTSATNALARLSYALPGSQAGQGGQGGQLYASLARRSRFPTIKDRYSARMGTALANPGLRPEQATHFELGYSGAPWAGAQVQAALFYSRLRNEIQTAQVRSSACGGTTCNQAQNIGRTRHSGLELALQQHIGPAWQLQGSYTLLRRTSLSDPSLVLTGTPRHRLLAAVQWQPHAQWQLRAEVEAERGRHVNFTGQQTRQLGGWGIVNLRARYQPLPSVTLDAGIANLGNKWYELADGLPMSGRTWYLNLGYRF